MKKKRILLAMLALLCMLLSACKENPTQEELYAKLLNHFEQRGYSCTLAPLADAQRDVPIYKASAWQSLHLNGEEVLVYFDESNRADYLSTFVDEEVFGRTWRFGLRFVLVYAGDDSRVLEALNAIEVI